MTSKTLSGILTVAVVASFVSACASTSGGVEGRAAAAQEAEAGASVVGAEAAGAPVASPPADGRVYTAEQADRGLAVFRRVCAECHYRSDFRGTQFTWEWRRRTVRDLFKTIVETMPEEDPGGLDDQEYIDVTAFILSLNGFEPGDVELPADEAWLRGVSMTPTGGSGP